MHGNVLREKIMKILYDYGLDVIYAEIASDEIIKLFEKEFDIVFDKGIGK